MAYAYPPQPVYAMRTTAPVSLHVVAIFQYLGGLVMLGIAALFGFAASDMLDRYGDRLGADATGFAPVIAVVVTSFAVVGLIAIVLGRKVQRGRNWARVVLILLNVLSVLSVAWQTYTTSLFTAATIVSLAMPVLFLILLNTRAARSWCRYGTY
jgi:hypothetical protein